MGKVEFNAKTQEYVHENGNSVAAHDIRTLPHHRKEVLKLAGADPSVKPSEPIENETQAELIYVERLLGNE